MATPDTIATFLFGGLFVAGLFVYWQVNSVIIDSKRRLDMATNRVRELKFYLHDLEGGMETAQKHQAGKASYKQVESRLSQVIADLLLSKKKTKVKAK